MRPIAQTEASDSQVIFLPTVFNETLNLLFDAHQYFQHGDEQQQTKMGRSAHPIYAGEMTRITMRLTSVMAWIMVRRAIHAGRIESSKAQMDYRLDATDICLTQDPLSLAKLPNHMIYLSERSLALYERVFRLDEMVYGERKTGSYDA
jgi:regulator of CtrA degradation